MNKVEELAAHMLQKGTAASFSEALEKAQTILDVDEKATRIIGVEEATQTKLTDIDLIKPNWSGENKASTRREIVIEGATPKEEVLDIAKMPIAEPSTAEKEEIATEEPMEIAEDSMKGPKETEDYKEKVITVYDELSEAKEEEKMALSKERIQEREQVDYNVAKEELTLQELMEEDARLIYGTLPAKDEIEAFERFEDKKDAEKKPEKIVLKEESSIVEDV